MSKPHSNSKLLNLPDEQQCQIAEWMLGGMPYHIIVPLVEKEFGVKASKNCFARFWQEVCEPQYLLKRSRAVVTAGKIAEEAKTRPGQFTAAMADALQQKVFELMIAPNADPDAVHSLFSLVLKAQSQETDKAKLALDAQRFQRDTCELFLKWSDDKRAQTIAAGSTSNADKIEALGQLMFKDTWK